LSHEQGGQMLYLEVAKDHISYLSTLGCVVSISRYSTLILHQDTLGVRLCICNPNI